MRGRTNIVQRIGAIVNGDQVEAEALEDIEVGSFVEVEYRPQTGKVSQDIYANMTSEKVGDNLWVLAYGVVGASYLYHIALVMFENGQFEYLQTVSATVGTFNSGVRIRVLSFGTEIVACLIGDKVFVFGIDDNKLVEVATHTLNCRGLYFNESGDLFCLLKQKSTITDSSVCVLRKTEGYQNVEYMSTETSNVNSPYDGEFISETEIVYLYLVTSGSTTICRLASLVYDGGKWVSGKYINVYSSSKNTFASIMPGERYLCMLEDKICVGVGNSFFVYEYVNGVFNQLFISSTINVGYLVKCKDGWLSLSDNCIQLFRFDESKYNFSILAQIQLDGSEFGHKGYVCKLKDCLIDNERAFLFVYVQNVPEAHMSFYKFVIENNSLKAGWDELGVGVKNYKFGNPIGFTKTGGLKGERVEVYVPYKSS